VVGWVCGSAGWTSSGGAWSAGSMRSSVVWSAGCVGRLGQCGPAVCGLAGWTLSGGVWVDVLLTVECLQQLCSVHININVYISTDETLARV